jgi:hypothetical protein
MQVWRPLWASLVVAALLACAGPTLAQPSAPQPVARAAEAPLVLGLAGAPIELFGDADAPTFEGAFAELARLGFDSFMPLFLVSETPDDSVYTEHMTHFLSPTLVGAAPDAACAGPHDPYAAAAGHLRLVFPGLVLLGLQDPTVPLDVPALDAALTTQRNECFAGHEGVVSAFYGYDEAILFHTVDGYLGNPQLELGNLAVSAERVRTILGLPTLLVEGAGGYALTHAGLPEAEGNALAQAFWKNLEDVAPTADLFGFDVYPVPDFPLTLPGTYVRHAREVAPDARAISVLQGMAFGRISLGVTPGRAPTLAEMRFMAIDSIASGADELHWYGASSLDLTNEEDAGLWDAIARVVGELRPWRASLQGAPVAVGAPIDVGVRAHRTADGVVVFVSHRAEAAATVRLSFDEAFADVGTAVGPEARWVDGGLEIDLGPYGAAILTLR